MEYLNKIERTIGGHLVRNLIQKDDKTIVGESANQYYPNRWEKVTWRRTELSNYYSCNLGEWWDIEI